MSMLSIEECVKDSPQFRSKLQAHVQVVLEFEQLLSGFIRSIDELSRAGNSYADALGQFSSILKSFSIHFDRGIIKDAFLVFHDAVKKIQTNFNILQDQVKGSFLPELTKFSHNEVRKVKDSRKIFDRTSDHLLTAVNRSVNASRQKPLEAEEASRNLEASRTKFSHQSVELAFQINLLAAKKQPFLLEHVISHLESQCYFYKVANGLLQDFRPNLAKYSLEMEPIQESMIENLKKMNNRKDVVNTFLEMERQSEDFQVDPRNPRFEGFLFKKKSKSAFKHWNRRYFTCGDFRLCYFKDTRKEIAVQDLKLCTVKLLEDFDRRYCFEVVTPTKTLTLQAETERERVRWCEILQACFMSNLNSPIDKNSAPPESSFHIVRTKFKGQRQFNEKLRAVPGNDICADCCHKEATWSSVNLGVILCIECSGIHRSLGVRVSKVRSLMLDQWEPESQKLMMLLGNSLINSIYEAYVPLGWVKPLPSASRKERIRWISAKYKYHYFVGPNLRSFVDVDVDSVDLARAHSTELLDFDETSLASFNLSGTVKKKRSPFKLPFLHSRPRHEGEGLALKQRPKSFLPQPQHLTATLKEFREPMGSLDKRTTLAAHSAFRRSFNKPGSSMTMPPPKPPRITNRHSMTEHSSYGVHVKQKALKISSLNFQCDEGSSSSSSDNSSGGIEGATHDQLSESLNLNYKRNNIETPPIPPPPFGTGSEMDAPSIRIQRTESISVIKPKNSFQIEQSPDFDLYLSAQLGDVPKMAKALAEGARIEYQNPRGLGATSLIRSTIYGNLMASEFLMQNGANIDTKDWNDQTALHHASKMGKTGHVCLFLKRGANKELVDSRGKTSLALALEGPHADIVTLLRLSELNDNMRGEQEFEDIMGDTVSVVFDDFSNIAVKEPERLRRNSKQENND
ncbi:Arf-GAP with coiled-coil, ANK repeat and PH domain-containing protein 2 [Oopsacas minuta]|uniref:Arf-GAP with coiled-coil, ANK repeat and PH domain-containing protein 2 n=1 Tax=Oopsacas minuta TaxID=111878 RepID=A0AAV7JSE8_9METZ|nr:Arf-GAP with coiled-coil, ANK repeat and PH domain-containing protein 2 [Oopsacas minuta]